MRVILITGKKQSGKNTVADMIRLSLGERNVFNVSFAQALKDMCAKAFTPLTERLNQEFSALVQLRNESKAPVIPSHDLHTTKRHWYEHKNEITRHILQIVGTEIVRTVDPQYWIKETIKTIKNSAAPSWNGYVTISDWRFPDEIALVDQEFPHSVSLRVCNNRVDSRAEDKHISENALNGYPCNHEIENHGSLEKLKIIVDTFIDKLIEEEMQ